MRFFLFVTLLLVSMNMAFAEQVNKKVPSYKVEWCNDVYQILMGHAYMGLKKEGYDEELVILQRGIDESLERVNEKYHFYFTATLTSAFSISNQLQNSKEKVLFLREVIKYAIDDLNNLDSHIYNTYYCRNCVAGENSSYVKTILTRAKRFGYLAKTSEVELLIFKNYALTSILMLSESRATRSYKCVIDDLEEVESTESLDIARMYVESALSKLYSIGRCY